MFKLHLDVFGYAAFINIYILLGKVVEAAEKNSKPQSFVNSIISVKGNPY